MRELAGCCTCVAIRQAIIDPERHPYAGLEEGVVHQVVHEDRQDRAAEDRQGSLVRRIDSLVCPIIDRGRDEQEPNQERGRRGDVYRQQLVEQDIRAIGRSGD